MQLDISMRSERVKTFEGLQNVIAQKMMSPTRDIEIPMSPMKTD